MTTDVANAPLVHEYRLEEDQELRFEVAQGGDVTLELIEGVAEVFGSEVVQHKKYSFPSGAPSRSIFP